MPVWRDPLDELIADLERVAPPTPSTDLFPLEKLQMLTDAILYGTKAETAALMAGSGVSSVDPVQGWEKLTAVKGPQCVRSSLRSTVQ